MLTLVHIITHNCKIACNQIETTLNTANILIYRWHTGHYRVELAAHKQQRCPLVTLNYTVNNYIHKLQYYTINFRTFKDLETQL